MDNSKIAIGNYKATKLTKERLPHFLGIGAQKSATRWLFNQLKRHPDVYLTPIKELHYFDRIRKSDTYSDRYKLDVWKNNFYKMSFWRLRNISWEYKFFFQEYSDDWYSSLFSKAMGRKAGEITPEYSILRVMDIEHVKGINPDMRIIYLLRNPVSRAWSHFRMHVRRSGLLYDQMNEKEVFKFIGSSNCFSKGDYFGNLKNWYSVFNENQVFTGFLEEVRDNPDELLIRILKHIGIESDASHFEKTMEEPAHVGQTIEIEPKYEEFLKDKYYQHNEDLYKMLGNPIVKSWNNET